MTKGPFNEEEITPPIGDCIEVRVESALAATQTIDYYALLAGAVRGLSKDTAALRHALYERGEIALIREIQKLGSFLTDDEITLQRLSFHEAVQKVEMECVLRSTTCASSVKVGSQERKLHVGASAITEGVTVETESNLNVAAAPFEVLQIENKSSSPFNLSTWNLKIDRQGRAVKRSLTWTLAGVFVAAVLSLLIYSGSDINRIQPGWVFDEIAAFLHRAAAISGAGFSWTERAIDANVLQDATLYEEELSEFDVKRYTGSVVWNSNDPEAVGATRPVASIEIPNLNVRIVMSFSRHVDQKTSGNDAIEIIVAKSPLRHVSDVPSIMLKQAEADAGERLVGIMEHLDIRVFVMTLSNAGKAQQYNRHLIEDALWVDVPLVYSNGNRAILAFKKDKQAFSGWNGE